MTEGKEGMVTLRKTLGAAVMVLAGIAAHGAQAQPSALGPEVRIDPGVVRGAARGAGGMLAYKGIPYAAPPVGNLRWRAPQPVRAWDGVQDHTQFGNRCLSALENDPEPGPPRRGLPQPERLDRGAAGRREASGDGLDSRWRLPVRILLKPGQ